MNIAIIPARGGSKRIPLKNIKEFNKIPMIVRTIRTLRYSGCFDQIIVSTDSDKVAETIYGESGVTLSWRDPSLSGDSANTVDVVSAEVSKLQLDSDADICCVYAPNPFLHPDALKLGHQALQIKPLPDYVSAVTSYPFPVQRSLKLNDSTGFLCMASPEFMLTHSQNLEERFHETAQFWWGKSETWLERKEMQNNVRGIYIPRWMSQDVDTVEDWVQAEIRWQVIEQLDLFVKYEFSTNNIIM